eukprot:CAMPEP_0178737184 /NCGR_PEP_ID=MMETSP0744-20121128/2836_1 /TAXON_ID=913974 /ORGANISM="Nitzschia punctata, Strain CCMP561" /LENGTH=106 /DNA_ID=CAMNT_0020389703 /DNA_START=223 /DNA_END=544 /DNA_ORIENTATION=+
MAVNDWRKPPLELCNQLFFGTLGLPNIDIMAANSSNFPFKTKVPTSMDPMPENVNESFSACFLIFFKNSSGSLNHGSPGSSWCSIWYPVLKVKALDGALMQVKADL